MAQRATSGGQSDREQLLINIGIISGYMVTSYVVIQAVPHIGPVAGALAQRARPHWNQFARMVGGVPKHVVSGVITFMRRKSSSRRSLLRWLGSNLPAVLFGKTPRFCIFMPGIDDVDVLRRLGPGRMIHDNTVIKPGLTLMEEYDENGFVVAYVKGSETDTESCEPLESILDTVSNIEETWGRTNTTIDFCPSLDGCSTPNKHRLEAWIANSTAEVSSYRRPMEESESHAALAANVESLQNQIAEMRSLFVRLLENQGKPQAEAATMGPPCPPPPAMAGPPPPPPPPPPPMMPTSLKISTGNQALIKLRVKSELSAVLPSTEAGEKHAPSLYDVLKGLSSVKLKPTLRSPGGTPFKVKKEPSGTDHSSMIAAALKKRFARIQTPDTSEDDADKSGTDKENQLFGKSHDSFGQSPSLIKPSVLKSIGTGIGNSQASTEHEALLKNYGFSPLKTTLKRKSVGLASSTENSPVPLFGQHLLKRRISSSLQKKLREQNQNPDSGTD